MRAQFEIDLQSQRVPQDMTFGIVIIKDNDDDDDTRSIALINPYGVTYIGETGYCTYSSWDLFKQRYTIVEIPDELTLTFKND